MPLIELKKLFNYQLSYLKKIYQTDWTGYKKKKCW